MRVKFGNASAYKDMFSINGNKDETDPNFGFDIKLKYEPKERGVQLEFADNMFFTFNEHEVISSESK